MPLSRSLVAVREHAVQPKDGKRFVPYIEPTRREIRRNHKKPEMNHISSVVNEPAPGLSQLFGRTVKNICDKLESLSVKRASQGRSVFPCSKKNFSCVP